MNCQMNYQTHHYGNRFHLIDDVFLQTVLTHLCLDETKQPVINQNISLLYKGLIQAASNMLFLKKENEVLTRMKAKLKTQIISPDSKAVTVNLARAGTYPSHICYEFLHWILKPENIRQDHIFAARTTNANESVTGTHLGSFKIGGDIENTFVIFPDPMGATGGTLISAINHYQNHIQGPAHKFIALHLIVTPEYLKNVLAHHSNVEVFALRVDRGLSSDKVLNSPLGLYWSEEKGLNDKQYIIPGAGGLGELLNNSFV